MMPAVLCSPYSHMFEADKLLYDVFHDLSNYWKEIIENKNVLGRYHESIRQDQGPRNP